MDSLRLAMPKDICCRRSDGPEIQAAIADAFLMKFGCGAALDFSYCFDTIDVDMLKQDPINGLQKGPLCDWANLMCNHWMSCERWIHYNKCVGGCLNNKVGIPQGDPASPLFCHYLFGLGTAVSIETMWQGTFINAFGLMIAQWLLAVKNFLLMPFTDGKTLQLTFI